jgi:hypothetical protein
MERQLNIWRQRNVSTEGKILLVKTFGLSQLIYSLQATNIKIEEEKKIEEITIERKISIIQEKQLINDNGNNIGNKRKRDEIAVNEDKEDGRPIRRLKEEIVSITNNSTRTITNNTNSSSSNNITTIIHSSTDTTKAEVKANDDAKTIKSEIKVPVQAPKRVINISFGLSDSILS